MWNLPAAMDGVEGVRALLLAWAVVFAMNVVTYPLPPAWMVLTAVHSYSDVPLLPLTVGGSAAAALGRLLFAWQVKTFTHRLPADAQANAEALVAAAHSHFRSPRLFVVIYSFLPISSDGLFTAVGLGALPWRMTVTGFFLARSVYNTLMVVAAGPVVSNFADLFAGRGGWRSIAVVALTTVAYAVFLKLPWARWLHARSHAATAA